MSLVKRPGYTLMELLVAVTIFSGLVILSLGTFARTISSSIRVANEREQTEATRSIFDQIVNDTNYLARGTGLTIRDIGCGSQITEYSLDDGYLVCPDGDKIQLLLNYTGSPKIIFREYRSIELEQDRRTIRMRERRDCLPEQGVCDLSAVIATELLPKRFSVVPEAGEDRLFFEIAGSATSRFALGIRLTTRPTENRAISDTSECLGTGLCYTLATTVVPGGRR